MEDIEKWVKASAMTSEALDYGEKLIQKGTSLLEVSEKVEARIHSLGGQCAFPVQISCDAIAAHYCSGPDDDTVFDEQLASLDVGVHVDGCIGDSARTVDLSGAYSDLVKAAKVALEGAIKVVQIGTSLGEIGKVIQETIEGFGYRPIRNLSGHGLEDYNIHSYPNIPNYDNKDKDVLKKGMIIAIEPFATDGVGLIEESHQANIFSLVQKKGVRAMATREALRQIERYRGLPFTTRWLTKTMAPFKVGFAMREMLELDMLHSYPPLVESNGGMVAQAEHTLLIDDKIRVLTRIS